MAQIEAGGDIISGRDIIVNEVNNNFVPFEQCNVEQLQNALCHHKNLAQQERKRINKMAFKILGLAVLSGLGISIWYVFNGGIDKAMFLVGLAGIVVPIMLAIKNGIEPSEFEQRQINTVKYINTLIRERK